MSHNQKEERDLFFKSSQSIFCFQQGSFPFFFFGALDKKGFDALPKAKDLSRKL